MLYVAEKTAGELVDISTPEIEISWALSQEIASWQRVVEHSKVDMTLANFERAAVELLHHEDAQEPRARQVVVNALHDMATIARIDEDDGQQILARAAETANISSSEARPPAYSDEALALRFAELHAADLRYVAGWGRWLSWDGARWRFDDTLVSFDRARKICRDAAAQCNKAKTATALASAKTVAAVSTPSAAWIDDCCQRDPQAWEQTSALFANWAAWAGRAGEHVGSQKRFAERLEARGAEPLRKRDGRGFVGIALRSATY
jgi:phage/plasmid-associated DNA primase